MRLNIFLVTKDHLIMLAGSNEINDELWAGHTEFKSNPTFETQTTNSIGFLVNGTVNTFVNQSSSNASVEWNHYASGSSPFMLIKKNFVDFGIVASSESCTFGSIQSRETTLTGHNKIVVGGSASPQEQLNINSEENQSVKINVQCTHRNKRDLETFELLDPATLNVDDLISDSEIEIEGI